VKEAKDFFEKYGGKSIILARFIPAVRTFTPIMAGVAQMRYRVFLMFNVIGGVLWAGGLTCAGYALVRVFPNAEQYITAIILLIILVSAIPLYKPAFRLLLAYIKKRKNTHTHTHAE
jgi:membrane-associated protein